MARHWSCECILIRLHLRPYARRGYAPSCIFISWRVIERVSAFKLNCTCGRIARRGYAPTCIFISWRVIERVSAFKLNCTCGRIARRGYAPNRGFRRVSGREWSCGRRCSRTGGCLRGSNRCPCSRTCWWRAGRSWCSSASRRRRSPV